MKLERAKGFESWPDYFQYLYCIAFQCVIELFLRLNPVQEGLKRHAQCCQLLPDIMIFEALV